MDRHNRAMVKRAFAVGLTLHATGCDSVKPAETKKSITPTPTQWDEAGFRLAFASAQESAAYVSIQDPVDWWKLEGKTKSESKAFSDSQWQIPLLQQHQLGVFLQMDPYRPHFWSPSATLQQLRGKSFADPAIRSAFIADAVNRTELYKPDYLCLAMEINSYYQRFPNDFDNFVSLYKETYAAVKRIKPDMVVFVSFQYEELLGRLQTNSVYARSSQWDLIDKFEPEQDAVGISSYPMMTLAPPRFGAPDDLPNDYYARIANHTAKPIIFAELGWPSDPAFGGSPQNQAAFLRRLPTLLSGLNVQMVNWMFLYDVEGFGPLFDSMGFFDKKRAPKPSWNAWQRIWKN